MNRKIAVIVSLLVVAAAKAWAQQPPPDGPQRHSGPGGGDVMAENFFPPELVMHNQTAIGLTADQQTAIKAEMQKSMARFTDLQWQQSAEEETMASLVKQARPDEKQALAQLDKLLTIENEVKRLHLATMIRIKNILTPEQQAKLGELKRQAGPRATGPQGDRGGPRQRSGAEGPGRQPGPRSGDPRPADGPPPPPQSAPER